VGFPILSTGFFSALDTILSRAVPPPIYRTYDSQHRPGKEGFFFPDPVDFHSTCVLVFSTTPPPPLPCASEVKTLYPCPSLVFCHGSFQVEFPSPSTPVPSDSEICRGAHPLPTSSLVIFYSPRVPLVRIWQPCCPNNMALSRAEHPYFLLAHIGQILPLTSEDFFPL